MPARLSDPVPAGFAKITSQYMQTKGEKQLQVLSSATGSVHKPAQTEDGKILRQLLPLADPHLLHVCNSAGVVKYLYKA